MTTVQTRAGEGVTQALAEYAVQTRYEDLSEEVREAARTILLDGLGCLVAGLASPVADILLEYSADGAGAGPCTVIGRGACVPATMAAFVNGALLHANDYEVQGQPPTHGTSNLLPVALAVAETFGGDGPSVLTAFAVGWEIQSRMRNAATRDLRGFHPPAVFGPLAAASLAGNMLGLDAGQLRSALGIAASRTGGLFANNGTMVKSTHPGNAGRMGLEAALLARKGFGGHPDIFAAHHGYVDTVFRGGFDNDVALRNLGVSSRLLDPGFSIKPYPAEIYMQWVIEAVADLRRDHDLDAESVTRLEIEVGRVRDDLSRPRPVSGLDGKFSYQYCGAVALTQERVGVASFSDAVRFSEPVERALEKVVVIENPEIPTTQTEMWAVARAYLADGRVLEAKCRSFRGSARNPMSREERHAKVRDCCNGLLADEQTTALIGAAESIDSPGALDQVLGILRAVRHEAGRR